MAICAHVAISPAPDTRNLRADRGALAVAAAMTCAATGRPKRPWCRRAPRRSRYPRGLTTLEDQWVRSKLQATDAEGDALTFAIVRAPDHATVSLDPATGAYELQPAANYFGTDVFEFAVSDGHGNAARARVEVSVAPVRDPPVIDASAMASVIAAGRDAQLHFAISDPDGDAVALSVSQVGGTSVLPGLQVSERAVRFVAPDVPAADDGGTAVRSDRPDRPLHPYAQGHHPEPGVALRENLFTVLGGPQSDGLHWVITGDGFTADEQQDLLRAAITMAESVAGAPELARHAEDPERPCAHRDLARQRCDDGGRSRRR